MNEGDIMNYDKIWDKAKEYNILQKKEEFIPLLQFLEQDLIEKKYCLEIGTNLGAASIVLSELFEKVITIDLVEYPTWNQIKTEKSNIEFYVGDSHSKEFDNYLASLGMKFPFIIIDGDHSATGADKDYLLAKKYLAEGGMIAFHDILNTEYQKHFGCYVHDLWEFLKEGKHLLTKEFICLSATKDSWHPFNVPDGMFNYSNWGGIGLIKPISKLNLKDVTLISVDCTDLERVIKAAKICMDYSDFGAIKILTDLDYSSYKKLNIEFVEIPEINSLAEYSEFILQELYKYIDTDYALIFQHDGFVLNNEAWTDEFLQYDYIGAPVTFFDSTHRVGNGGFSLRSKKLMEKLGTDKNLIYINHRGHRNYIPEDEFICSTNRIYLESLGIKFAPFELAEKFAIDKGKWTDEFGFHNTLTDISNWKKNNNIQCKKINELMPNDITITTLYTSNTKRYADITAKTMRIYANKHGYNIREFTNRLAPRHPSWSKILAIQQAFDEGAEVVLWMDADAIVLNPEIKIESFLDDEHDIIITEDKNGLNCGIMILKNTKFTKDLLKKIWNMEQFISHMWWEQGALQEIWKKDESIHNHFNVFMRKGLNSELNWFELNDFILHLSGILDIKRYEVFKTYYSLIYNKENSHVAMHSGNMGDIIFAIPVLKELGVDKLYLYINPEPQYTMKENRCKLITPLLKAHGFEVEITHDPYLPEIDYYIDIFREFPTDLKGNHLTITQGEKLGITPDLREKFLEVDPLNLTDIIISRSCHYKNKFFDWGYLLADLKHSITFIGTKAEYNEFKKETLLTNVNYYYIDNLYSTARIIAGAKVFIGNQSVMCAIADGLKVNRIQETDFDMPTSISSADNQLEVKNKRDLQIAKKQLYDWLGLDFIELPFEQNRVMLFATGYVSDQDQLERYQRWIDYYLPRKEKLGVTHIVIVDDGSPVSWINKLDVNKLSISYFKDFETKQEGYKIPKNLSTEKVNWLRFQDHLGRPAICLIPGWWRSYSFATGVLGDFYNFDKIVHVESDAFILTERLFEFIKNAKGYGSLWSPVSDYRETAISWCDKNNYFKARKFFMSNNSICSDFWWQINLSMHHYLPEFVIPFDGNGTNALEIVRQFKGDRLGDGDNDIPMSTNLDFICNTHDSSLFKRFHPNENWKLKQLEFLLQKNIIKNDVPLIEERV